MSTADAKSVLGRVTDAYASMSTYRDNGEVIKTLDGRDDPNVIVFETLFRRPHFFRFSFSRPPPGNTTEVLALGADAAYLRISNPNQPATVEVMESLPMAIAGATGSSAGAVHTIGGLLLSDVGGFRLQDIVNASIVNDELFEGAHCLVLLGHHAQGGDMRVWVDRDTLTIRQYAFSWSKFISREIRRNIRIDDEIPASAFQHPKT